MSEVKKVNTEKVKTMLVNDSDGDEGLFTSQNDNDEEETISSLPATFTSPAENAMPVPPTPQATISPVVEEKKIVKSLKQQIDNIVLKQVAEGSIGTVTLTKEQERILYAPVSDDEVEIREDGLVYLSWTFYASRLRKAFGLRWSLLPAGEIVRTKNSDGKPVLYQGYYLFIDGKFITYVVGEHTEQRTGSTMSYGETVESAYSNALMRCCKHLGIGLEMWNPAYVERWKKQYTVAEMTTTKSGYKRMIWRRKTPREIAPPIDKNATVEQANNDETKHFLKNVHALKDKIDPQEYANLLAQYNVKSSKDLKKEDRESFYLSLSRIAVGLPPKEE